MGEEGAFAFVADDGGEEPGGFAFEFLVAGGGREFECESADVFYRLDLGDAEGFFGEEVVVGDLWLRIIAVFDGGEVAAYPFFELVEAGLAAEGEGHLVGAVVAVVEVEEFFALNALEGSDVAGGEIV